MEGCCPSVDEPVICLTASLKTLRMALRALMWGDMGAAIGRAYVFGFMTGALHLVSMWIDYMGFATMHYCQVMVIAFCGGLEAIMLFMNMRDGGPLQAAIYETTLTQVIFWMLCVFACVKCYAAVNIYKELKIQYFREHG